ncbi:MAG: hypothetical protein OHK93_007507 [Ramalina farinacea]|uniref:Uncharacterized protein n=1 Tax=Ramalina farinacea TaxID=258253 RepID=A0AA43QKL7_9LECA|nr:hypothetical protein [Ramalina farinacea]
MDVRLETAGASLATFLEDDLSGSYLGLGKEGQAHLERFRSFLHTYYIGQYGYWPPPSKKPSSDALPKHIIQSMYLDFRNLYGYLADRTSGVTIQENRPVDGGICVFQNITNLDKKFKNEPLPHPLPLVPKVPVAIHRSRSLFNVLRGNKSARFDRRIGASEALTEATNSSNDQIMKNNLVREYLRFEKLWTLREDSSMSCADGRKVRWFLVYTILQLLVSVTKVPKEVRDIEGVLYPLCCQIAGTPPWPTYSDGTAKKDFAVRPTSLKEQIMELGPDLDVLKPSPLVINTDVKRASKVSSPSRRSSFVHKLSLKSPKPIRAASIDFLTPNDVGEVSPIDEDDAHPIDKGNVSPIDFKLPNINLTPTSASMFDSPSQPSDDPSTPSASEKGGSSTAWSASSSDDGMEHHSVAGTDSNYGDDEDEEASPRSAAPKVPQQRMTLASKILAEAPKRAPSSASFMKSNPEVEQFLLS